MVFKKVVQKLLYSQYEQETRIKGDGTRSTFHGILKQGRQQRTIWKNEIICSKKTDRKTKPHNIPQLINSSKENMR